MKRRLSIVLVALLLTTLFITSVAAVYAYADASTHVLSCSSFSASGTSDAPYVTIYASNFDTGLQYYVILPVSGGTFSGTVNFPTAPVGTFFDVEAWGTPDPNAALLSPGYWDEGDYYRAETACSNATVSCPYPLPDGSVVYDVPAGAPAFYDADLSTQVNFDLPAGTWKISEFKGDFAKVWISCGANPVWIPKNAVGAAVG